MISGQELVNKIKTYQNNFDSDLVLKAYDFSLSAHSNQSRSSGDPYFSHPLAVAEILAGFKLDSASIITALLHDTVEDTDVTLENIEKSFGEEISKLVDGVTKLTKIEALSSNSKAAENFRKLVMAMSEDIRVLLVKLADRLHNMRTINYIPRAERRIAISNESLSIYAPLAARIGMYQIRDELQELSFAQIHPEVRNYIVEKISDLRTKKKDIIEKVIEELKSKIVDNIKNFEIVGREKSPYSIWMKMKSHNIGFNNINDVMGFRILVDEIPTCYQAFGIINCNYRMIPGTFSDYISTPKENGYKSLHLAVLGPENKKVEIQIRTKEMHNIAEYGVAAHWSYKEKIKIEHEHEQYKWIRELISLFEHAEDASEVLHNHKIQIHKDQVFCFTPGGDIFNLPNGATIIDFAYAIHSDIGNSCVGAKVNGNVTPLRKKLENGDQIEIITDKKSKPSPAWLQFVTTAKAKTAIKHFIRNEKHLEYSALGKAIINKFFVSKDLEINEDLLKKALIHFNKKNIDDLYIFVAEGIISRTELLKVIYPEYLEDEKKKSREKSDKKKEHGDLLPIEGLIPGMSIHFAGCCHPIPGDLIVGVINTGTGITIHNQNCYSFKTIAVNNHMIVDVCWKDSRVLGEETYPSTIKVTMANEFGSLANISSIIAQNKVSITNIKTTNRTTDFFELIIDLNVKNLERLEEILSTLRTSDKIVDVIRIE